MCATDVSRQTDETANEPFITAAITTYIAWGSMQYKL